ncbi:MAG: carbohydrate kinase [Melioribacteraceae bacterium]|nr:carbohydrate kinase [Melioribacteraceae bacterium]
MKNFCIVGVGEILWDVFPQGRKLGGAPANFSYICKELGAEAYVISAIGNDEIGKELIADADKKNINKKYIQIHPKYPTGEVSVVIGGDGEAHYKIHELVAWDSIKNEKRLKELLSRVDAISFGTLAQRAMVSRNTIREILYSTAPNAIKMLDLNLREQYYNKIIIEDMLLYADVLKLNEDELPIVAKYLGFESDEDKVLKYLLEKFSLNLIAYTKGKKGSRLITAKEESVMGSPKVDVVDTVGAGDAFSAALVMGLLNNLELKEIHGLAVDIASYVCTQNGAMPEIPEEIKIHL